MTTPISSDYRYLFEAEVPFDGRVPSPTGRTLDAAMTATQVPAVSVAAVVDEDVRWAGAWGRAGTDDPREVTTATLFQAGSISKTVAAFCALRLIDAGHFGLDDNVNDVAATSLIESSLGEWNPRVSVRQLLAHTAATNNGGYPGYSSPSIPDGREVIRGSERTNTPPVRVIGLPGTRFSYSGGGYVVLQEMISAVTGHRFEDVAEEVLFHPAGMSRTTYDQHDADPDRAFGHRDGLKQLDGGYRRYPEMAAAGLWTTATDLARFLGELMRARRGAPNALISHALAGEMFRPQSDESYGLGVRLSRHLDSEWFGHGGDTEGFAADLLGTSEGLGVAIMTNADVSWHVINAIRAAVGRLHAWPGMPIPVSTAAAPPPPVGDYLTTEGIELRLERTDSGATMTLAGQRSLPLSWDGAGGWTSAELSLKIVPTSANRLVILQTRQHGPVTPLTADKVQPAEHGTGSSRPRNAD